MDADDWYAQTFCKEIEECENSSKQYRHVVAQCEKQRIKHKSVLTELLTKSSQVVSDNEFEQDLIAYTAAYKSVLDEISQQPNAVEVHSYQCRSRAEICQALRERLATNSLNKRLGEQEEDDELRELHEEMKNYTLNADELDLVLEAAEVELEEMVVDIQTDKLRLSNLFGGAPESATSGHESANEEADERIEGAANEDDAEEEGALDLLQRSESTNLMRVKNLDTGSEMSMPVKKWAATAGYEAGGMTVKNLDTGEVEMLLSINQQRYSKWQHHSPSSSPSFSVHVKEDEKSLILTRAAEKFKNAHKITNDWITQTFNGKGTTAAQPMASVQP